MKHEITFTPIDLRTWSRGEVFTCFSKMAPTGYSLTAADGQLGYYSKRQKSFPITSFPIETVDNLSPELIAIASELVDGTIYPCFVICLYSYRIADLY